MDILADLVALVATALAVVGAMPQLRRLRRTRDIAGVSLPAAMVGVASELGWMAYCTHESLWSAVPIAVVMTILNALTASALVRSGASRSSAMAGAATWAVTLAASTAVGGWAVLGALLPLAYGAKMAPAVICAYRTAAPTGVAAATWAFVLVESVLWAFYGVVRGDLAIMLFAAIGVAASVAIVARLVAAAGRIDDARRSAGDTLLPTPPTPPAPLTLRTPRPAGRSPRMRRRLQALRVAADRPA